MKPCSRWTIGSDEMGMDRDDTGDVPPADTADAGVFVPVARVGEIPAGTGKTCEAAGRLVAVFFDGRRYHAMDDLCPHMGASLGAGLIRDGEVVCPWHAWCFRAEDGRWCEGAGLGVEVFEVRVSGDVVEARVTPR